MPNILPRAVVRGKMQNKSEREIQGKLINLNKQYILNPSDSLKKDMEKTEMELKKS
jgi:hypothetical protein